MARIRTIKPEFFTSEDIYSLSPLARILYVGIWCEADREGRLEWKPKTLKIRYLPHDDIDINNLCVELLLRGLVVLYGDGCAYVPTFKEHQVINNKERPSVLPDPSALRVADAITRVKDAPSLPSFPFPSVPEGESRGGGSPLIMSPAEHARRLEFCAFVGSRLQVPKSLHAEMRSLLGGPRAESELLAWYEDLNTEIEASAEPIVPDVFKWLKARYAKWKTATTNDPVKVAMAALQRQKAETRR